jgi:hypothetical protein
MPIDLSNVNTVQVTGFTFPTSFQGTTITLTVDHEIPRLLDGVARLADTKIAPTVRPLSDQVRCSRKSKCVRVIG